MNARPCRVRVYSLGALVLATAIVAGACAEHGKPSSPVPPPAPAVASFTVTAYCTGTQTATGARPNEATIAADPAVFPLGSKVKVSGISGPYNRVYTVGDTGANIRGRRIDLYMRDCREARSFGRRSAHVALVP